MPTNKEFDFWIENGYNVLFNGKHGTGKTSMVLEAFNRHGLKWQYFSASTMDPWVDFVGVPKERVTEDGTPYLDLVRPLIFQNDEIQALFFDEYNRSSKKVRNAVMELIQFKSINGKKFNNLKIVWAAINPADDEEIRYDVEKLDAAQLDRFHFKIDIPYSPNVGYFTAKYGAIAGPAIEWWKTLTDKLKKDVSPRRLDYVLDIYQKDGDIRNALPKEANITKLIKEIESAPVVQKLKDFYRGRKKEEAARFLVDENNYFNCVSSISQNAKYAHFFVPLLPKEKIVALMANSKLVTQFVSSSFETFESLIREVAQANSSPLAKEMAKVVHEWDLKNNKEMIHYKDDKFDCVYNKKSEETKLINFLTKVSPSDFEASTDARIKLGNELISLLPQKISTGEHALRAYYCLCVVALRCQAPTINKKIPDLIPSMNHLIASTRADQSAWKKLANNKTYVDYFSQKFDGKLNATAGVK